MKRGLSLAINRLLLLSGTNTTCRHCILDSVKTADYILPRLKDIARIVNAVSICSMCGDLSYEVEGVKIIFTEQQYEDIFSLLCLEQ